MEQSQGSRSWGSKTSATMGLGFRGYGLTRKVPSMGFSWRAHPGDGIGFRV